jgi:hypothetical protein
MKRSVILLALLALGCAQHARAEAARVTRTDGDRLRILLEVHGFHRLTDPGREVSIRLFETGGGDPAMNGNRLLLALVPASPEIASAIWETGIDVYQVDRVTVDPAAARIVVEAREHVRNAAGAVVEQSVTYAIGYEIDPDSGEIAEAISVQRSGDPPSTER